MYLNRYLACASLCLLAAITGYGQTSLDRAPFVAADAHGASRTVYQLTNVPGLSGEGEYDWSALYYHNNDSTLQGTMEVRAGSKLVLRRLARRGSPDVGGNASSLVYYTVDLDTGKFTPVTAEGLANGAFVQGRWLYVMERDKPSQHYFKLARYDILGERGKEKLGEFPDLANNEKRICNNIPVSDDQHYLIWTECGNGERTFYLKDLKHLDTADRGRPIDVTAMAPSSDKVEHFQFLKGRHAHVFICMSQANAPNLRRIGIGWADAPRPACVPCSAPRNSPLSHYDYAHPFVDTMGNLWSVATRWDRPGHLVPHGYVRLEEWDAYGHPTKGRWFDMNGVPWQVHTNYTMRPEWFVGDGAGVVGKIARKTDGPDAIQLLHMANGKVTSTVLAMRGGVDSPNGDLQPNVHTIRLMGSWGAVWTEYRTLVAGQAPSMNVFFAPLPDLLQDEKRK